MKTKRTEKKYYNSNTDVMTDTLKSNDKNKKQNQSTFEYYNTLGTAGVYLEWNELKNSCMNVLILFGM